MSPGSTRWRPRRAGIINLYEYADQVFEFAGGRLLLRGHNTSGKTKALELLLPFCLDGDISPKKLDPFGAGYKDMKWNLTGCTGDVKRVGYAWLEFERIGQPGTAHRLTVGVGMRHNKDLPDVARWYFVARDRTIGSDLSLLQGRDPISKAELVAALGDDGEVLETQRDYRARLNDLLFAFGGEEQYQTMLRLMRDLRRPHLSKTLDPERVAAQLTVGLPEVDEALMRKLAGDSSSSRHSSVDWPACATYANVYGGSISVPTALTRAPSPVSAPMRSARPRPRWTAPPSGCAPPRPSSKPSASELGAQPRSGMKPRAGSSA